MESSRKSFITIALVVIASTSLLYTYKKLFRAETASAVILKNDTIDQGTLLSIDYMRKQNYPGSDLQIEQTLSPGSNYNQYIASYKSENLKIYGLLTVPFGKRPTHGWPAIIFIHGYIRPSTYKTTELYVPYVRNLAKNGYIVFKPDFRGHDKSEGKPDSQYFSPSYTIDILNAMASVKRYPDTNPEKIGMWGHSDGGNVILRSVVVNKTDIKAAVIWGGVVAPYTDLTTNWQLRVPYHQPIEDLKIENNHLPEILAEYGTPSSNPNFWKTIEPLNYLADITTPIQLDTGDSDEQVPPDFSLKLKNKLQAIGKVAEYYNYPMGDHNISSPNFEIAMKFTVDFFDSYLK